MPGMVIGGGIGGLCTAVALQQKDLAVRVYEAAPEPAPVGAGIWIAPNAMAVLDRLGLSEAVRQAGAPVEQVRLLDHRGRLLSGISGGDLVKWFGHTITSIHRARLHQVLLQHVGHDTVVFGKRCSSIENDREEIRVTFDDGEEAAGRFLIGADGLNSVVRQHLFPSARLRYSGETCWRGVSRFELPNELKNSAAECWGRGTGKRFGFSQLAAGQVYWWAARKVAAGGTADTNNVIQLLPSLFGDFLPPIPSILANTPPDTVTRHDLYDLAPLPRWSVDRATLLGDAAHAPTPNLGQGGAQAIEDAWVVAHCMHQAPDITTAFERYETIRKRKANRVVRDSRRYGRMAALEAPLVESVRNLLIRLTPGWIDRRYLTSLYRLDY